MSSVLRKQPARKVAFLIPDFGGGGAEPMIIRLANEFAARGHIVDLVTFWTSGPNRSEVSENVNLIDLGVGRVLLAPLAIRRYLRRSRPDVAISALFHTNIFTLAARLSLPFSTTRVIVSERNMLSIHVKHSKRRSRSLFKLLAWLLYRTADRVVGISEGVAADIQEIAALPDHKVCAIQNPTVTPAVIKAAEAAARDPDRTALDGQTIVTVGRLEPQKDHETLLHAFSQLLKTRPAHLVVIGEGSLRSHLSDVARQLGIQDRVHFPGYIQNPFPLMQSADLFVLSSIYEGFGNVLVEALLCGLQVVSTDCPSGPREILNGGEFGALVPPGDADELAAAMADALSSSNCGARQTERAKVFSLERSADRFEELVNDVCVASS